MWIFANQISIRKIFQTVGIVGKQFHVNFMGGNNKAQQLKMAENGAKSNEMEWKNGWIKKDIAEFIIC